MTKELKTLVHFKLDNSETVEIQRLLYILFLQHEKIWNKNKCNEIITIFYN